MNYFDELKKIISNLDQDQLNECLSLIRNSVRSPNIGPKILESEILRPSISNDTHKHQATNLDRRIFICGNGGSASSANHIACDFQKGLGLNCQSLCENMAIFSAWSNDTSYEEVFSNQLKVLGKKGDLLILLSGSGNSPNILHAEKIAKELDIITTGWCMSDGKLLKIVDYPLEIKTDSMQVAEDCHMIIGHYIYLEILKNISQ
jgi:D-sedoheptulose 7-phosphate isomerase